jgi:hypothetical protein
MFWKWLWAVTGVVAAGAGYLLFPVSGPAGLALISGGTEMVHHAMAMP